MSVYSTIIEADTPIAYWRVDEPSGTVAADQQGAHPGAYSSGVLLNQTPGAVAPSGDLDAAVTVSAQDVVSVPDSAALRFTGDFTLEGWVKL